MEKPRKRIYSRKLTPAHAHALAAEYRAGSDVRTLMSKYGLSRTTLYRYLQQDDPQGQASATYWRLECTRLKEVVVDLTLQLTEAKKTRQGRPRSATLKA